MTQKLPDACLVSAANARALDEEASCKENSEET